MDSFLARLPSCGGFIGRDNPQSARKAVQFRIYCSFAVAGGQCLRLFVHHYLLFLARQKRRVCLQQRHKGRRSTTCTRNYCPPTVLLECGLQVLYSCLRPSVPPSTGGDPKKLHSKTLLQYRNDNSKCRHSNLVYGRVHETWPVPSRLESILVC